MHNRPVLGLEAVFARTLGDLSGLDALDMGAGSGPVTRRLAELGARATGIEPNSEAVAEAKRLAGGPTYITAGAEATGLPAASVDLVLFSNSLHHCPDMPAALTEALRLLRPAGRLAVLEPEANDPFWHVMRWIDDEAPAYASARAAVEALVAAGRAQPVTTLHYATHYRPESLDAVIARLTRVDSGRSLDPADRPAMQVAFDAAIQRGDQGGFIPQWQRLDVLRPTAG